MFMKIGRLILAFGLVGVAAYLAYAYVTMPYQLITRTTTFTQAEPHGGSYIAFSAIFAVLAIVAAFSGDWHD